jgi:ribonuclease P protein component
MRFRPEQHLRRQDDIRAVREQGHRVDCRAFTLLWRSRHAALAPTAQVRPVPAIAPGLSRVCFVASIAAVGAAVQRNRAKRRLREVFRHHQHLVPAGCDLMLIARAAAARRPMSELAQKFTEACGQIAPAPLAESP